MRELIGKTTKSEPQLPRKLLIIEQEVFGKEEMANELNTFFRKYWHRVGQKYTKCVKAM